MKSTAKPAFRTRRAAKARRTTATATAAAPSCNEETMVSAGKPQEPAGMDSFARSVERCSTRSTTKGKLPRSLWCASRCLILFYARVRGPSLCAWAPLRGTESKRALRLHRRSRAGRALAQWAPRPRRDWRLRQRAAAASRARRGEKVRARSTARARRARRQHLARRGAHAAHRRRAGAQAMGARARREGRLQRRGGARVQRSRDAPPPHAPRATRAPRRARRAPPPQCDIEGRAAPLPRGAEGILTRQARGRGAARASASSRSRQSSRFTRRSSRTRCREGRRRAGAALAPRAPRTLWRRGGRAIRDAQAASTRCSAHQREPPEAAEHPHDPPPQPNAPPRRPRKAAASGPAPPAPRTQRRRRGRATSARQTRRQGAVRTGTSSRSPQSSRAARRRSRTRRRGRSCTAPTALARRTQNFAGPAKIRTCLRRARLRGYLDSPPILEASRGGGPARARRRPGGAREIGQAFFRKGRRSLVLSPKGSGTRTWKSRRPRHAPLWSFYR